MAFLDAGESAPDVWHVEISVIIFGFLPIDQPKADGEFDRKARKKPS